MLCMLCVGVCVCVCVCVYERERILMMHAGYKWVPWIWILCVNMCLCVYIHIHTCIHTYMHTYIHHTYIHTYIHTYSTKPPLTALQGALVFLWLLYLIWLTHTHIRTYIHACIHTYMHTYIHAYIHTYIQYKTSSHRAPRRSSLPMAIISHMACVHEVWAVLFWVPLCVHPASAAVLGVEDKGESKCKARYAPYGHVCQ